MGFKFFLLFILAFKASILFPQGNDTNTLRLIDEYLQSPSSEKSKIARKIIANNIDFDLLYNKLKKGKTYTREVTTGFVEHLCYYKGIEHPNLIYVPRDYNPEKKYQVRIFLHGAVTSLDNRRIYNWLNMSDTSWNSVGYIGIFPSAWMFSKWWDYSQYMNINNLLDFVKGTYNVDENDVSIAGVSDGATGVYCIGNYYATPFSCFLPYIGSMEVLPWLSKKQFYLNNYQGQSFFIVNTRKDVIFNIDQAVPYVNALKMVAANTSFFIADTSGHNMNWYPVLKDTIRNFIEAHKRNPYPERVVYATENSDTLNRKFWVIIEKNDSTKQGGGLVDYNQVLIGSQWVTAYPRKLSYGQIEVTKDMNTVYVKTTGVKKYTLLFSPEQFDFTKLVKIYTDNYLSFEGFLEKDIETLLKYNIIDNDSAMLFGARKTISVGKAYKQK